MVLVGGGGSSSLIQEIQYLPGVQDLIRELSTVVPKAVSTPMDVTQTPTAMENVLYGGMQNLAAQGFTTPADQLIANTLLGRIGGGAGGAYTGGGGTYTLPSMTTGAGTTANASNIAYATLLSNLLGGQYGGTTTPVMEPSTATMEINIGDQILKQLTEPKDITTPPYSAGSLEEVAQKALLGSEPVMGYYDILAGKGGMPLDTGGYQPLEWKNVSPETRLQMLDTMESRYEDYMESGRQLPSRTEMERARTEALADIRSAQETGKWETEKANLLESLQGMTINVPGQVPIYGTTPTTTQQIALQAPEIAGTLEGQQMDVMTPSGEITRISPFAPQAPMISEEDMAIMGPMLDVYKDLYGAMSAQAGQQVKANVDELNKMMAARGRIGSGAQVTGVTDIAQQIANQLATSGAGLGEELIGVARGLRQYETPTQLNLAQGLADIYGTKGLASTYSTALQQGAVPRKTAAATTQAQLSDLMYRMGLGSRLAGGFGGAMPTTKTTTEASDLSGVIAGALQPVATGLSKYLE